MAQKIFKVIAWAAIVVLFIFYSLAIVYKNDPVIRLSVRTIFVSAASIISDAKDLKDLLHEDIKKELKDKK